MAVFRDILPNELAKDRTQLISGFSFIPFVRLLKQIHLLEARQVFVYFEEAPHFVQLLPSQACWHAPNEIEQALRINRGQHVNS